MFNFRIALSLPPHSLLSPRSTYFLFNFFCFTCTCMMLYIAILHSHNAIHCTTALHNLLRNMLNHLRVQFIMHIVQCNTESSEVNCLLPQFRAVYLICDWTSTVHPEPREYDIGLLKYKLWLPLTLDAVFMLEHWLTIRHSHVGFYHQPLVLGGTRLRFIGHILAYSAFVSYLRKSVSRFLFWPPHALTDLGEYGRKHLSFQ